MKAEPARPLIKIMNAKIAEHAGTLLCLTLHMVNTNMTFVWRHPKYYKPATNCRRDNKPQKGDEDEQQATSDKQQATSGKRQAPEQEEN